MNWLASADALPALGQAPCALRWSDRTTKPPAPPLSRQNAPECAGLPPQASFSRWRSIADALGTPSDVTQPTDENPAVFSSVEAVAPIVDPGSAVAEMPPSGLSTRELEVLQLVASGYTTARSPPC